MKRGRFNKEQVIANLREQQAVQKDGGFLPAAG